jgi:4-amino-4-deoxy-L-arabinose transferase-like glycosyltransferase
MKPAALVSWISRIQESPVRRRWFVLTLSAAIALVSHVIFIRFLPAPWQPIQSSDYRVFYEPVARQLAAGRGFYLPSGKPALTYPPGIPIVYGATFRLADRAGWSHQTSVTALQALLTILSAVLVAAQALQCYGARIALLACALWSTYPFHLWLTKQPSGEVLICVLQLSAVLIFVHWSAHGRASLFWGSVCGATLGFAALTKPFTIALPTVFLGLAWICSVPCRPRKRAVFSLALLFVFALSLSPWELWAWRVSGEFVPLCINGPASVADGITFGGFRKGAHSHPVVPANVAALAKDLASHREDLLTTGGIARLLAVKAKEKPIDVASLFLTKAVQAWYGNDSHTHEKWTAFIQLSYLPLFVVGAGLAWLRGRQEKNFLLIAAGITIYYWGMTTFAALAIVRYMVPAVGLLMVLAADSADVFVSAVAWRAGLGGRSKFSCRMSYADKAFFA